MSEMSHQELLDKVLERVIQNNLSARPGTPMAELKEAIESAIQDLPTIDFEEFNIAVSDRSAADRLVEKGPEIIGWNADKIIEWIESLSQKMSPSS